MMFDLGVIVGIAGALAAVAVPIFDVMGKRRAVEVTETIIETINGLDRVIGTDGQRQVKKAVRRKSIENLVDKDVHAAVKSFESGRGRGRKT